MSDYFLRFRFLLAHPPSHTPSQQYMSFDFSDISPFSVFTTYAQPSAFGLLIWYETLLHPKASNESESKNKNLMSSPELRLRLFDSSSQPLMEDNRCSALSLNRRIKDVKSLLSFTLDRWETFMVNCPQVQRRVKCDKRSSTQEHQLRSNRTDTLHSSRLVRVGPMMKGSRSSQYIKTSSQEELRSIREAASLVRSKTSMKVMYSSPTSAIELDETLLSMQSLRTSLESEERHLRRSMLTAWKTPQSRSFKGRCSMQSLLLRKPRFELEQRRCS